MTDIAPTTYNPPQYLIETSGLTAAQLTSQFEAFKDSIRFVSVAPELVFERVITIAFGDKSRQKCEQTDSSELSVAVDQLRNEVNRLKEQFAALGNQPGISGTLDTTLPPTRLATPIEFAFTPSSTPYSNGHGVEANIYGSDDGLYGSGCAWSSAWSMGNITQYGIYNTTKEGWDQPLGRCISQEVNFSREFSEVPLVVIWFTGVDIRSEKLCYVKVRSENIKKTGFKFTIESSETAMVYSAGISWVAGSCSKSSVGSFNVIGYPGVDSGGTVTCKKSTGSKKRHVLLAVKELFLTGTVKMPITLGHGGCYEDKINWSLKSAGEGCSIISLGVVYVKY